MSVEKPLYNGAGPGRIEDVVFNPLDVPPPSEAGMTMLEDGSVEVDFGEDSDELSLANVPHNENLVDWIDNKVLDSLSSKLIEAFKADKESRADWEKTYMQGLDLLGLKFEDRTEPWDGACGVFHPMLTDSVVRFQAQTIQEVFPASGPVKCTVVGKMTTERTEQANRVVKYMNYTSTKKMVEYRTETEKLLFSLPIAGSAFRKIYFDPNLGRPAAMFVPAEDFVVSYGASDLSTCERATHIMRRTANEVRKSQVSGFYTDIELDEPTTDTSEIEEKHQKLTGDRPSIDFDNRYKLLEMYVELDLEGFEDRNEDGEETGVALPYVVTVEQSSGKILAIYRNWKEGDPNKLKRDHVVHYMYMPGLGFYGFGLVHMIGGLSKSATSLLRQLVDSGTLANLPGGLKARGLRIKGDDTPIKPGEFRDVDIPGGNIRDNIAFLPYKEPSGVLYNLLNDIVGEGRRFASAADVKVSDMNGEAPVGTTLAILEREMKVLSAVQARVHAAMGRELQILADIIKDFGPEQYPYEIDGDATVLQDFDERVDIIPVSDPNAGTMAQRIMQWQAALQLAQTAPQLYKMDILHRRMLGTLGIEDAQDIVPVEDDLKPTDPITETMNLIKGEPVKAFLYQDHEAHIEAHMAAAQNPQIIKLMQQHPNIQMIMAAGAAHIAEHLAFAYRQRIEKELGVPLPSPEEPLPQDIELRLSRLVAPAAAQLTGKAQKMAKAEEDAKKQQDPIIQLQQKELEIKDQAVKSKAAEGMKKIEADLEKARRKEGLERDKLKQQGMLKGAEIAAKVAADQGRNKIAKQQNVSKQAAEGYRLGLDTAKTIIEHRRDKRDDKQ